MNSNLSSEDINSQNEYGKTKLMTAAEEVNIAVIRDLLKAGANVNLVDQMGRTALMIAIENFYMDEEKINWYLCLEELIKAGTDLSIIDDSGKTVYNYAENSDDLKCLKLLKESSDNQSFTIFEACHFNDVEQLKELISQGEKLNERNSDGLTPLLLASKKGSSESVEILIKAGASIDDDDHKGQTALWYASRDNHYECMKLLLSAGAEVNKGDNTNYTPLMAASSLGPDGAIILLDEGADVNATDNAGYTALMHACMNGKLSSVKILIATGANVTMTSRDGDSALSLSKARQRNEIVNYLKNF